MKPETRDEALHSLEGLLKGIWMDGEVNEQETVLMFQWMAAHQHLVDEPPFDQLLPALDHLLEDQVFHSDELEKFMWMIEGYKMTSSRSYIPERENKKLTGLLRAVVVDGEVSLSELHGIHDWFTVQKSRDAVTPDLREVSDLLDGIMQQEEISEEALTDLLQVFRDLLAKLNAN